MKTIIIGIDGGTWDVMLPLIEQGKLPNIARLMETGAWGNLHSTYPPITIPAWVSCVTGVNPGKLGLFHFLNNVHEDYKGVVPTPDKVKVKRIWDILNEYDKQVILTAIPFTNPPPEVKGAVLSSARLSQPHIISTYPQSLLSGLKKALNITVDSFKKDFLFKKQKSVVTEKTKEAYLAKVSQIRLKFLEKVKEATIYLMQHFSWDFLMVVFSSSDFLQHHFWAYRDPAHPLYEKKLAQNFGNVIDRAYTDIDQGIGDILKTSGPQVNVFIVSDHGFGPLHKQFFVNNWLRKKGWLCLKKNPFCLSYVTFSGILSRIGLGFLRSFLPSKLVKIKIPGIKRKPWPEIVDWKRTVAYYMGSGININLKGREPLGIVNPGKEYENIIEEIRKELYEVKDPETDEKIVNKVFRPEEIYHGPYVKESPDLLFFFKNSKYLPGSNVTIKVADESIEPFKKTTLSGHHYSCFNGIFILNSPAVMPGSKPNNAHIMDITPTALYLMGLPIPEQIDGRALLEVIKPEYQERNPLRKIKYDLNKETMETKLDEQEQEKIKEELRGLGYLG